MKVFMKAFFKSLVAAAVLSLGTAASASVVGYSFTTATNGFVAGSTGQFSYEDTSASFGTGTFGGTAYTAADFTLNGNTILGAMIEIFNDLGGPGGDDYVIVSGNAGTTYLQLGHLGPGLFASDALVELNLRTLADFDIIAANYVSDPLLFFPQDVTSLVFVPEPGSLALVGLGAAVLALRRRRGAGKSA